MVGNNAIILYLNVDCHLRSFKSILSYLDALFNCIKYLLNAQDAYHMAGGIGYLNR